jgi:hypothetical protein
MDGGAQVWKQYTSQLVHIIGVQNVAAHIGVSRQAVYRWERVPLHHVAQLTRYFPGIPRECWRPDIFGLPRASQLVFVGRGVPSVPETIRREIEHSDELYWPLQRSD